MMQITSAPEEPEKPLSQHEFVQVKENEDDIDDEDDDPDGYFGNVLTIAVSKCKKKVKIGDEEKEVMPKKCAQQAAIGALYAGERFTQKNYGLFYKAFPHVWKSLAEEGGEYISLESFPHLVRNCQNANNIDVKEAENAKED